MSKQGVNLQGKITRLLGAGLTLKKIAKLTGKSYHSIWKKARRHEREGILERTCKYPALYRMKKEFTPSLKPVGDFTPIFIPHKCGASFVLVGRPALPYNALGKATLKEGGHTVQFGRSKAQIWLKVFRGANTSELIANSRADILNLAAFYSETYEVKLSAPRFFLDVEWLMTDKKAGKKVARKCKIAPTREIAKALFKFDDATHPDLLEINQAPRQPPEVPTDHAKTLEFLLLKAPVLLKDIVQAVEGMHKRIKELEKMEIK